MKKVLVAFYSQARGNTARIAKMLASSLSADILQIDTAVPYSCSYDDIVEQGQREVRRKYKPELKPADKNPEDYDIIAVGTPTWWYTMSPAVRTFLSEHNWQGKTVIPFSTNGGWQGHVIKDMETLCTGATFVCPMQVRFDSEGGDRLETPEKEIADWQETVKTFVNQ